MHFDIDGRTYEMPEFDSLTFREAKLMKQNTGLTMGRMLAAFEEMDSEVILALALVAIRRQDGSVDVEALYDLPINKVQLVVPEADEPEEGEEKDPTGGDEPADEDETPKPTPDEGEQT